MVAAMKIQPDGYRRLLPPPRQSGLDRILRICQPPGPARGTGGGILPIGAPNVHRGKHALRAHGTLFGSGSAPAPCDPLCRRTNRAGPLLKWPQTVDKEGEGA